VNRRILVTVLALAAWLAAVPAEAGAGQGAAESQARGAGAHASAAIDADGFLLPDRKTWCSGTAKEVGCVSFRGPVGQGAGHGAILRRGGKVTICPESSAGPVGLLSELRRIGAGAQVRQARRARRLSLLLDPAGDRLHAASERSRISDRP
jgi:hypothetical protein